MTTPRDGWRQIPKTPHFERIADGLRTYRVDCLERPYGLQRSDGTDLGVSFFKAEDAMETADTGWPARDAGYDFIASLLTGIALAGDPKKLEWTRIADTGHFRRDDGVETVDAPAVLASANGEKGICLRLADGKTLFTFAMTGNDTSNRPMQWPTHAAAMRTADMHLKRMGDDRE